MESSTATSIGIVGLIIGVAALVISLTKEPTSDHQVEKAVKEYIENPDNKAELVEKIATSLQENNDVEAALLKWKVPTLINGWTRYSEAYNPIGYVKTKEGFIHIRGLVKSGGTGTTIFMLPEGYRPEKKVIQTTVTNSTIGRVDVSPTGEVVSVMSHPDWLSIDGIIFKAKL